MDPFSIFLLIIIALFLIHYAIQFFYYSTNGGNAWESF